MIAMKVARLTSSLLSRKGSALPVPESTQRGGMVETDVNADAPLLVAKPARGTPPHTLSRDGANRPRQQSAKDRVRVSLRLDPDRHRRLKLVAMQRERTLQSILSEALDGYLKRCAPDVLKALAPTEDQTGDNDSAATAKSILTKIRSRKQW